jgi:NADPH2:quinone reductase
MNLHSIPGSLPFEKAAAAPLVYQTAWRALTSRAGLAPGETLLVTGGSGGVSTAAIQIAKHLGAQVLALTSGPENVSRCEALGAVRAFDRLVGGFTDEVRRMTGGAGADVILDSVGEALWPDCLRCLGPDGRLVVYGATTGPVVKLNLTHLFWKQQRIIGSTMASREEFEQVMDRVADGILEPVVHSVRPLDEIRSAHEALESGEVFGKMVLVP